MNKTKTFFSLSAAVIIIASGIQAGNAASPRLKAQTANDSPPAAQGSMASPSGSAVAGTAQQGLPADTVAISGSTTLEPADLNSVNKSPVKSPRFRAVKENGAGNVPPKGKMTGEQRRSAVANAIQEMHRFAERNQGIGQQIRTVAQNQNSHFENAEKSLDKIKNRNRLMKFFFGENWSQIFKAEKSIRGMDGELAQLKLLSGQIADPSEKDILSSYIASLEIVNEQLKTELGEKKKLGGIFGILNRWIAGALN